jgi:hypothetical protein
MTLESDGLKSVAIFKHRVDLTSLVMDIETHPEHCFIAPQETRIRQSFI